MSTFLRAVALILVMLPVAVTAEPVEIEFDAAVQRAREHAPELRAQRAGVSVAAARLQGVRRWRTNPSLAASSGPRIADGGTTIDWMLGLNQPIAPGGRPAARADVEAARYRVEQLEVLDAERETAGRAARAFARLLYWQDRAALAARNLELATEIESVATRRNAAGDVGGLDPAVALLARSRAEADIARIEAARIDAEAELRWLIGGAVSEEVIAAGDLRTIARAKPSAARRSDVAVADAQIEVARARQHLAKRDRVPRFTIGVAGGREENATVLEGVLEVTLPIVSRGQADLDTAIAAEQASSERMAVVEDRAKHEIQTAQRKVVVLDEANATFAEGGLTAAAKTAEIATASYKAGAIPLPDLLVVRRELIAAEQDFAEMLLLAAVARIEVLESSGAIQTQPNP